MSLRENALDDPFRQRMRRRRNLSRRSHPMAELHGLASRDLRGQRQVTRQFFIHLAEQWPDLQPLAIQIVQGLQGQDRFHWRFVAAPLRAETAVGLFGPDKLTCSAHTRRQGLRLLEIEEKTRGPQQHLNKLGAAAAFQWIAGVIRVMGVNGD
ncbi:hypothetical protein D3C86_1597950 [compost metagenome]